MTKFDLIIFDFDGVLRPISFERLRHAYDMAIHSIGKDPRDFYCGTEGFRGWFNHDWHKTEENIFGAPYEPRPEFDAVFHQHFDPSTELFPWVPQVLEELSSRTGLAILSSSNIESVVAELGSLRGFFQEVVGGNMVVKLKPNPEGIFRILKQLRIPAEKAIMIGDADADILAGKAAGVKTAAILWGIGEEEELRQLSPDFVLSNPNEIIGILR